jgi:hypothetical protein
MGGHLLLPGAVEQCDQVIQRGRVADLRQGQRVGRLLVDRLGQPFEFAVIGRWRCGPGRLAGPEQVLHIPGHHLEHDNRLSPATTRRREEDRLRRQYAAAQDRYGVESTTRPRASKWEALAPADDRVSFAPWEPRKLTGRTHDACYRPRPSRACRRLSNPGTELHQTRLSLNRTDGGHVRSEEAAGARPDPARSSFTGRCSGRVVDQVAPHWRTWVSTTLMACPWNARVRALPLLPRPAEPGLKA